MTSVTGTLFALDEGKARQLSEHWYEVKDGNAVAYALFKKHYTFNPRRCKQTTAFAGVGEKIVMMTATTDSLFVWRRMKIRKDDQTGVECSVFRNEGDIRASDLIREAVAIAHVRWPGERLFTFVNPRKIQNTRRKPGYCFRVVGFRECGITKQNRLIIRELSDAGQDDRSA